MMKKKINLVKSALVLSAAALLVSATACHADIYGMINTEVALESTGIAGDIKAIVPFGSYIYLTNGSVYRKENVSSNESKKYNGQWSLVTDDEGNKPMSWVYGLASDSTHIYAYTIKWVEDESEGENTSGKWSLYSSADGVSWNLVEESDAAMTVFDNQYCVGASDMSNRHAFVRKAETDENGKLVLDDNKNPIWDIYSLSGGSVGGKLSSNGAGSDSINAVYYKGADYFAPYHAFAANDKYIYYSTAKIVSNHDFANSSSEVYYADQWSAEDGYTLSSTGEAAKVDPDAGAVIALAVTADHLLMGTKSGIRRVAFAEDGVPGDSAVGFESGNNALSLLTSYVPKLFVRDTSAAEGEDDEYASMVIYSYLSSSADTFKEIGLYAYYRSREKAALTWNRDGADN